MPAIETSRSGRLHYRPLERVFLAIMLVIAIAVAAWGAWIERRPQTTAPLLRGPAGSLVPIAAPVVTEFDQDSQAPHQIQSSTSWLLPPYYQWEANGSAGAKLGFVRVRGGLLTVGVRSATPDFRGYFLTTRDPFPAGWYAHTWAVSPPAVTSGVGELVFAVQTATTDQTGLINYVFVSLVTTRVRGHLRSTWEIGYAYGYEKDAHSVILKKIPESAVQPENGMYHLVIWTDGSTAYRAWINGEEVFASSALHMQIAPPFDAYLEVQEKNTPYAVQYRRFAAVQAGGVLLRGLPARAEVLWKGHTYRPKGGDVVLPVSAQAGEASGHLSIVMDGKETGGDVTLWAGQELTYES
ncbi:MAG: hypothetical protein K6T76_05515 [Alicyclobacillus mali]|uniref:hypothetical protein n=1 Tax=Alicyclobacillus mali (ex Roth et al. 2021) TaxID=1123961 RepID=UPI00083172D8|nr:hypothetical protein [Alicyclobacillus mali (ex Roth et al. 2021)]MCL6488378.1 hypothetical protein [Alicyclobacillus mali (ex Roth et al. 2021)]